MPFVPYVIRLLTGLINMNMPKMTYSRDRFYVIETGYHKDGTFFMYPFIVCMWCGTGMIDFTKAIKEGKLTPEEHLIPMTPEEHYELCGRFKE